MKHYELPAMISGRYAETELDDKTKKIEEFLAKHGDKTHYLHNFGRRKLAYPIKNVGYGYYILAEFDSTPESIAKLNRDIALWSDVIRHIIVSRDTIGTPQPLDRKEMIEERKGRSEIPAELRVFTETPAAEAVNTTIAQPEVSEPVVETAKDTETPIAAAPAPTVIEEIPAAAVEESDQEKKKKKTAKVYENLDEKLDKLLSGEDII